MDRVSTRKGERATPGSFWTLFVHAKLYLNVHHFPLKHSPKHEFRLCKYIYMYEHTRFIYCM